MRDLGAILWVAIVLIGVISSIVSNARKQAARSPVMQRPPARPQAAQPIRAQANVRPQAPSVRPQAAVIRPQAVRVQPRLESMPALHATQPLRSPLDGLFANRRSLARAVVAAEVLGRPLALRDGD